MDHIRSTPIQMKNKISSNPEKKSYVCPVCYKCMMTTKYYFKTHKLTHSKQIQARKTPFYCSQCKEAFPILVDLEKHVECNGHNGERPYSCSLCKHTFLHSINLKSHNKTHIRKLPNFCKNCDKGLLQPIDLKEHNKIHTGKRPFWCSKCVKNFTKL